MRECVNFILNLLLTLLSLQSNDVTMQMSLLYLVHKQSGKGMNCQKNDLNSVNFDFNSSNRITVTDHCAQSRVDLTLQSICRSKM